MIIEYFKLATSSLAVFSGVFILTYMILYFPCTLILQIIHKLIRAKTISKNGYPPPYCDADGDIYTDDE